MSKTCQGHFTVVSLTSYQASCPLQTLWLEHQTSHLPPFCSAAHTCHKDHVTGSKRRQWFLLVSSSCSSRSRSSGSRSGTRCCIGFVHWPCQGLPERTKSVLVWALGGPMVLLTDPALDNPALARRQGVQSRGVLLLLVLLLVGYELHPNLLSHHSSLANLT